MSLWLKIAARNLRSGLKGFWILLICLTLGVASMAMIGSLASSFSRGLAEQGQVLLGGDVEFALVQREASADELNWLNSKGVVSHVATLRAMAQVAGQSILTEVKAVDETYPLFGKLDFERDPKQYFVSNDAREGIAVEPALLTRLNAKLGDDLKLGDQVFAISAVIHQEPDRISSGIAFGPRILLNHQQLALTHLILPGSLVNHSYRLRMQQSASLSDDKAVMAEANWRFPQAGWKLRSPDKAAQGADEFVGRLATFMTLVSISALIIGGAGIANAVAAFVARRRVSIAVLKSLGASTTDVLAIALIEILAVSVVGIIIALALGAATPWMVQSIFGHILPLPLSLHFDAKPLLFAGFTGLLVTLAFSIWPLARLNQIKGAELFRAQGFNKAQLPPWPYIGVTFACLGLAAFLAIFYFDDKRVSASFVGGLAASYLGLILLSWGMVKLIAKLPAPSNLLVRQAVKSIHRPGAVSHAVIMSLGLGFSLFVMLALTDQTISHELTANLPDKAPAFFFIDVPGTAFENFKTLLTQQPGVADLNHTPMLRGRIVKVRDIATEKLKPKPDGAWALNGDRGLTFADELPSGSSLVTGQWWAKDYTGPPLVSIADDIAEALDLKIGDPITVNVLGRDVTATIASTRHLDWKTLRINFVLVFNRTALEAAPHSELVTAQMLGGDEGQVLNTMAAAFPSVTSIRVKEALQTIGDLLNKMLSAVRGANIVALLTGVLVLAGALAAGLSTRSYEAVVLKTYGATRAQLLTSFVIEYGLLGLISALFGICVGGIAAWALAFFVLKMPFSFPLWLAALTALLAMVITIAAGLAITWRALSAKPSIYLRNE